MATRRAAVCLGVLALVWIFPGASAQAGGLGGPRCNTNPPCSTTQCWVECAGNVGSETELRQAVAAANTCSTNPTTFSRIIWFKNHTGTCKIDLANSGIPGTLARCPALGQYFDRAICVDGHDITIYGGGTVRFIYTGSVPSSSKPCTNPEGTDGPPAFVLLGTRNALVGLETRFFPEGIDVRGFDNVVEDLTSDYFCDEAVSVNGASSALVHFSTFRGHTSAAKCASPSCGRDKAIQILNGGTSEIRRNTFIYARAPVEVLGGVFGGTHTIADNVIEGFEPGSGCGDPFNCNDPHKPDSFCEELEFEGGNDTVTNNEMTFCKFGITVKRGAMVTAVNNWIMDGYLSAFRIEGEEGAGCGTQKCILKGTGNHIVGAGWNTDTINIKGCRGGVTILNNFGSSTGVDFNLSGTPGDDATRNHFCQNDFHSGGSGNLLHALNLGNIGDPQDPTSCTTPISIFSAELLQNNCFDYGPNPSGLVGPFNVNGSVWPAGGNCNCDPPPP